MNRLDEPVFMAVSKPLLTEFGIHPRLESCALGLSFDFLKGKEIFCSIELKIGICFAVIEISASFFHSRVSDMQRSKGLRKPLTSNILYEESTILKCVSHNFFHSRVQLKGAGCKWKIEQMGLTYCSSFNSCQIG